MIFRFSDYVLDIDVDRTRDFYARDDRWQCDCRDCQNYDKAILTAPEAVLDFLRNLGIDPLKPAEIFNVTGTLEEDGTIWYNGWFHVCGTLVESSETVNETMHENGSRSLSYRWELGYRPDPDYPFVLLPTREISLLPEGFPTPALELEIDTHLPWVLPISYED